MVNSQTSWDYSNTVASLLKPTTFSWETMWTVEKILLRRSFCFLPTKLNSRRTFSCWEVTMSAVKSTASMASTTSVNVATQFVFGRSSRMSLTVCQSPLSSTTRSFACTAVSLPSLWPSPSYSRLHDLQKCLRTAFFATYFGQILKRVSPVGAKTTEVFHTLSVKPSSSSSSRKTTLISFAEPIKS